MRPNDAGGMTNSRPLTDQSDIGLPCLRRPICLLPYLYVQFELFQPEHGLIFHLTSSHAKFNVKPFLNCVDPYQATEFNMLIILTLAITASSFFFSYTLNTLNIWTEN